MKQRNIPFSKWFDPYNIYHIKAYVELQKNGIWPREFIPHYVYMDSHWQIIILNKLADKWITYKMKG